MVRRNSMEKISRRDFLAALISTLVTVVIETIVIAMNIDSIAINSVPDLLTSPFKICVYISYILSVVSIPAISLRIADFLNDVRSVYRFYVIKSLALESVNFMDKISKILPLTLSTAFLFIIISVALKIYIFSLVSLIPLALYLALLIRPLYSVYNHCKRIDMELPWFLVLLIVVENIGSNIRLLIERLRYTDILPSITRELLIIDRDSKLYSKSYTVAITERAKITPNARLSDILSGYASRLKGGGNISSWLLTKLDELLMATEFSMKLYSERIAAVFGQLMLALYVVIPLVSIAIYTINIYAVLSLIILATPILILSMYITRPKNLNSVPITRLLVIPTIALVTTSISLYRFLGPHSIVLGWFVSLILVYINRGLMREIDILEKDSVEVIKIIAELKQSGLDIVKALEFISTSTAINRLTIKKLRSAISMLHQGIPLTLIATKIPSHSFLFRFTLFTLGLVHECGGGSPEVFRILYEYVTRIRALHSNVVKMSRFFDIFAFVNIFVLTWIWKSLTPIYASLSFLVSITNPSINIEILYTVSYISALSYALTSSTLRNGLPIIEIRSISLLLAIAITTLFIHIL